MLGLRSLKRYRRTINNWPERLRKNIKKKSGPIGAAQICLFGRALLGGFHIAYPGYLDRLAESHMVGKEKHYMWGVAWIWTQDVVVWWEILDWSIIFFSGGLSPILGQEIMGKIACLSEGQ
jgi:hypothetical protein